MPLLSQLFWRLMRLLTRQLLLPGWWRFNAQQPSSISSPSGGRLNVSGFLLGFLLILTTACTPLASDYVRLKKIPAQQLIDGSKAFPEQSIPVINDADIIDMDDDMQEFSRRWVAKTPNKLSRLRRLLRAMQKGNLLNIDYFSDKTYTASQTFYYRQGNCLSFTNLFVALARNADLDVQYQMVEIPPVWTLENDFVLLTRHINVLVDMGSQGERVIDFNETRYQANYPTFPIRDSYAFALYYNNLGAVALQNKDHPRAFAYFKKAIQTDSSMAQSWSNLGALYSRLGHFDYAESAYHQALAQPRREKVALSNLVRLYRHINQPQLARHYEKLARSFRDKNPYYHHHLAQETLEVGKISAAFEHLQRAIELRPEEHIFYNLQADLFLREGKTAAALKALKQARFYSTESMARIYQNKIDKLVAPQ